MILRDAAEPTLSALLNLGDLQHLLSSDSYSKTSEAAASCWPVTSQRW
jgi:hypothetical protein